jgi:rubrerythrin
MKILESAKEETKCANCGFTAEGRFKGDICPRCGLAYWQCTGCGFLVTAKTPPDVCPECAANCAFTNVTCYTPDCGGPGNVDTRLLHAKK